MYNTGNITIENTLDSKDYEYEWIADPSNNELDLLLSFMEESKIEIPLSYFKKGNIDIVCQAKNVIYNTYANYTLSISVTDEKRLKVGFSITNNTWFYPKDTIFIQGFIEDACEDNSIVTFSWKYLSSYYLDFDSIISNSPYSNSLFILTYTLNIGKDYMFMLTSEAESRLINGTSLINIKIKPNHLYI